MAKSLLAHLYTHIKGSQEDVATLSLQYLLMQSTELNKTFTKNISAILHINTDETLSYQTQVTGEENERPDMVGINHSGKEQILLEMKFYAGLTENQPIGYLDRLKKNKGKGLLFICPKSRINSLWLKLLDECEEEQSELKNADGYFVEVDGVSLAVVTWSEVIGWLMNTAESVAEVYTSDIKQLKGYCEEIDSEAFIPFTPEDLSVEVAKKEDRYYLIIDETARLLLMDKSRKVSEDKRKSATNRNGYSRWIYVGNYGLSLYYDRTLWKHNESTDTPFWLLIRNKKWVETEKIIKSVKQFKNSFEWGNVYLPLEVPLYATEDEVCVSFKKQIIAYLDKIDNDRKRK